LPKCAVIAAPRSTLRRQYTSVYKLRNSFLVVLWLISRHSDELRAACRAMREVAEIKKCSTRLSNQTVLQTRMRSRRIAIARHCRRGPACAYPAIRDGWRSNEIHHAAKVVLDGVRIAHRDRDADVVALPDLLPGPEHWHRRPARWR